MVLRIRKDRTAHDSRSAPLPKPVFLWHAMQNDIDIFRGIKSEIQKNPENFKPAGQWLDDFCQNIVSQEEQYIKKLPQTESNTLREIDKKKNLLKKIHKEKKTLTGKIAPYTHNDKKYKKEKKQLAELFCEANQLTLEINKLARELEHIKVKSQEKPGFIQLMSKAFTKAACEYPPNSRKIMLIAWLLTDKYLSESKLGITKYEQYVFHHEVREPEGNGPQRLVSEQEMAKDAVLARPGATGAMEKIRDAYLSYQGLFPGESIGTAVQQTPAERNGGKADTKPLSKDVEVQFGSDTPVALREFMREYCEPVSKNMLESRVKSLQGLAQRGVITLKHTGEWQSGQSKKYLPNYLISNWETFREKLTSLPKLKQS